ncbi:MAG: RNA polymerase sigma factor [Solirubrobacteraceae bacterium]
MDDRARFEALFRAHAGAVRTYARRRSDAQTADDVVADVFVVVWRRLGDVPDDPLPWLLGVARRTLANQRRGAARRQALNGRMMFEQTGGPSVGIERAELDEAVGRALGALRERDREVLLLVGWEGLSLAQAAQALGLRANTFAARLSRARRRFAAAWAAEQARPGQQRRSTEGEAVR